MYKTGKDNKRNESFKDFSDLGVAVCFCTCGDDLLC